MSKTLYISATEPQSGKSAITLGVMQLLLRDIRKVAFFRPIINGPITNGPGGNGYGPMGPMGDPGRGGKSPERDHDIDLILRHFELNQDYEDAFAYTLSQARDLINAGKHSQMLENILTKYKDLESRYDFVLCLGTDFMGKDANFEFDLNAEIASNLGSPLLVVANGQGKNDDELIASTQLTIDQLEEKSVDILSVVLNRVHLEDVERVVESITCKVHCPAPLPIYVIPEMESLGKPTMGDVMQWMGARVLYGEDRLDTLVGNYLIAAMMIRNFLDYVEDGSLIITPGDRSDLILASLVSRLSSAYGDISGILLTGGLTPSANVDRLIKGWTGVPIPVLVVEDHTYKTVQRLNNLYGKINPEDTRKVATALGVFEQHVDTEALRRRLIETKSSKVTPKMFEYMLIERAKTKRQRIVLPEGEEERVLRAADIVTRRGVAEIVLLGEVERVRAKISQLNLELEGVEIVQPSASPHMDDFAQTYHRLRRHKGVSPDQARDAMGDVSYFGTMMVRKGLADGMVSGAVHTTGHTIRPAFEFIKTKPGYSIVSSVFLMCLKDRVLVFGDCAVNPNPTAPQLAEIAINSAETAALFGIEPRVAMLSYSTGGSGQGEDVDRVVEATKIAKDKAPDLLLEGPIQYDAAIDPDVAATKLPDSQVAGRATVFIFPDLNTGNNTYKAVQRAAQAVAIGPVLQGLNKPVNDLSRGALVADIVNTVAITAIQAQTAPSGPMDEAFD